MASKGHKTLAHRVVEIPSVRLDRLPTHESVANELREQILNGQIPANSALPEADLCQAFNVSRHTVRSALQVLAYEGLIRQESHRAAYVPVTTPEDITDIYVMREILEQAAVNAVAGNERALEGLEEALTVLRELGPDADWGAIRDGDLAFHQSLVEGIGSPRATRTFAALRMEIRLGFLYFRDELDNHSVILEQHQAIFDALRDGETERASELVTRHLRDASATISTGIDANDESRD